MTRRFSLAALAVTGALLLAACGGSGTSSSSGSGSTPGYGAAKPSTPNTSNTSGATSAVSTKTSSLCTSLVDATGNTLNLWNADKGSTSACSAACAQAWPPLTATATPKANGAAKA